MVIISVTVMKCRAGLQTNEKLATPQIVLFENGKAKWNSVDNAQSYSVRVYKYDKAAECIQR